MSLSLPASLPSAEIYNTTRFAALYHGSQNPTVDNLGLASKFLMRLFRRNEIPFAFLGGWAVFLRGSQRLTQDVDVAVGSTMEHLKVVLAQQSRVCIPQTHGATCIQIFLHTGGSWDPEAAGTREGIISVDVIINGNLGTPPELPDGSIEIMPVPSTTQGAGRVPVIDVFHQFSSKLRAHASRRESGSTNDFVDLQFLIYTYGENIHQLRHSFDVQHRWLFWTDFALQNGDEPATYLKYLIGLDESLPVS